ncbi:hypothetical protein ACKKBG_A33910 [Auxenochlorella protothecoides x Auxenochlorella symbiontica]
MFRKSFHRQAHPATQDWLSVECFRCARGPGTPEWVEKDSASQREGRASLSRRRSERTGCQHTFTVKQLRQDSKKSIVFYPDIGHLAHSDAAFHWLRLSQWAVDLVESLPTINPAFRNPSIVASEHSPVQEVHSMDADPDAATSLMKAVQARRSDFAFVERDNEGLIELVELNDNHQRVLRDHAHGCLCGSAAHMAPMM